MDIKDIRKLTNLSQVGFCKITGINQRTLEDWERGLHSPPAYVNAMLEFYVRNHWTMRKYLKN